MSPAGREIRFLAEGMEVPAVTADQMREVDRIAMQETGPNLFQMMENAGLAILRCYPWNSWELVGTRLRIWYWPVAAATEVAESAPDAIWLITDAA